jgi:DNA polymerase III delta prime subunit
MKDLLLHPQTRHAITAFQAHPSHALLLSGPSGTGKQSLAVGLSEQLLALEPGKLGTNAYARVVTAAEGKSIGIEAVRELEHFLSLKVPGNRSATNRVIIIVDAHLLTIEAQNGLLKTIEEPPEGTTIVLTVAHEQALLPTIRSRSQNIAVKRPEIDELRQYFAEQGFAATAVARALAMSGGLPGLTTALLNESEHPLVPAALKARELLSQSTYERLAKIDELAQQRALCLDTLFIMQQMALISLQTASGPVTQRWQGILIASRETQAALAGGAQPKLALSNFLLRI